MQDRDFTGGNIASIPAHERTSVGDISTDQTIRRMVDDWLGDSERSDLVSELVGTALKTGRDNTAVADLKLMNRALREMRRANKIFESYRHVRKVSVFGSARTRPDEPAYATAVEFARRMAAAGYMVITGGGDGIMGAAQHGAGRENGFGLNIQLPFEQSANATITGDPKLLSFKYFFTRKLSFVKEADAFASFAGGFGTIDETFEALTLIQTGKATVMPIVLIDAPGGDYWQQVLYFCETQLLARRLISQEDLQLFKVTSNLDDAVREITGFYKVFHSYRYVGKKLAVRLKWRLTPAAVATLNEKFSDLFRGTLEQRSALPEETNEEGILHLPRLTGVMTKKSFGRLRHFIDAINTAELVKVKT
ncbi:MAG: TIGR00730 family Rossman fold protein [Verrucomicrobiaceae bacterium]|nr:TIGR00730 family Rossman fold protein [Verrucomicrobiaceae bacterium]